MCKLTEKINLRHNIYFSLNLGQQRKLNKLIPLPLLENLPMEQFKTVTKSKKLIADFVKLKQMSIRKY